MCKSLNLNSIEISNKTLQATEVLDAAVLDGLNLHLFIVNNPSKSSLLEYLIFFYVKKNFKTDLIYHYVQTVK